MYFQKSGRKYSFIYYDVFKRKNVRLKASETPFIPSDEEAHAFCREFEQKNSGTQSIVEHRLAWKKNHPVFIEYVESYEKNRREDAPNSFEADLTYLAYYVLPYFLEDRHLTNVKVWHLYLEDFRDYLQDGAIPIKRKTNTRKLSYATCNNVIKSLNSFLLFLYRRRKINASYRCRYFSQTLIGHRDESSVIEPSTQEAIWNVLSFQDLLAADMFWVALHSGLRLNELLGLSLADFSPGLPSCRSFRDLLKPFRFEVLGFLSFESQPKLVSIRNSYGQVPRKPLKGKKKISKENGRIVPICEVRAFNILVKLWNIQRELYIQKVYGPHPKDYLLFGNLNKNTYSNALRKAQKDLPFDRNYTPHDARHTYSTLLAEKTGGSFELCRMILGHSRMEVTLKYVHMNARLQALMQTQTQLDAPMDYAENMPMFERFKSNVIPFK